MLRPEYRSDRADSAAFLLAKAIAGYGIGSHRSLPAHTVDTGVFLELLELAGKHRLIGAVAEATADGALKLTTDQEVSFVEVHQRWLRLSLEVEALLVGFHQACSSEGIELRVLKGVALAHLVYSDPSWRIFGDLDVLVPSRHFDAAVALACSALGGTRAIAELRPRFDHEFGKDALVRVGRVELDVHRTFVTGPFGLTVDLDRLFDASSPFVVGGKEFLALDQTSLLVHACYNAALGDYPFRLCALRDLAMATLAVEFDAEKVAALAGDWRAEAVVQRAAQLTVEVLDLRPDHPLHELVHISVARRESWLLKSYLNPARSYSRPLASLTVIPGISARLRYGLAILVPSRSYLRSRGWTWRSHLRRASDRLLRRG